MDVSLTTVESAAIRKALRSYLSDLRAEIVDTDNAQYKQELREERSALEAAIEKLDRATVSGDSTDATDATEARMVRVVEMWWSPEEH